jgi:DNA helicase IV
VHASLADEGSIGLIAADADLDRIGKVLAKAGISAVRLDEETQEESRLVLVPATLAKGLEYDQVIVVEPTAIAAAEHDALLGLRRLYVVLTRAVTRLTVLHARPLPAELAV